MGVGGMRRASCLIGAEKAEKAGREKAGRVVSLSSYSDPGARLISFVRPVSGVIASFAIQRLPPRSCQYVRLGALVLRHGQAGYHDIRVVREAQAIRAVCRFQFAAGYYLRLV